MQRDRGMSSLQRNRGTSGWRVNRVVNALWVVLGVYRDALRMP